MNTRVMCGMVNESHLNKTITINGWVKKNRKLGSLLFLDIYDKTGVVQVVAQQNINKFSVLESLTKESVVNIKGKVILRKTPNDKMPTGQYEIELEDINVYSNSQTPPFLIQDDTDGLEDIRLKYRYLDLRRPVNQKKIMFRSMINHLIRTFLIENSFTEVETPALSKQTPEGARDYIVPTRNKKFYALPQSPQIYKQLLMISGFERYFQFTKCFRDEDLRSDRQPEFTQLDIETSFLSQEEIMQIIENMIQYIFDKGLNKKISIPFQKMDYNYAIENYGSDKPDLRFDMKILDVTNKFTNSNFKIFSSAIANNNVVKAIVIDEIELSKNKISELEKFAIDNKAKGLAWLNVDTKNDKIDGSIAKVIEKDIIYNIFKENNISKGTILFVADKKEIALSALGAVRVEIPKIIDIKFKTDFAFAWIVNWPLYEYDSTSNRYVAAHHPFTSPTDDSLNDFDVNQENAKAKSYDIVLNGYEIGGGSIRIYNSDVQKRLFKSLGLKDKEIEEKFGFLINAFQYGVPPHGGIALGMDRLIMLLTESANIREVIAFPKNSSGIDLMMECPSKIDDDFLKELGIKMRE